VHEIRCQSHSGSTIFGCKNKKFKRVVEEAWRDKNVQGWMSYVLKEKLKGLKGRLRD
jgi:hypothetical protein